MLQGGTLPRSSSYRHQYVKWVIELARLLKQSSYIIQCWGIRGGGGQSEVLARRRKGEENDKEERMVKRTLKG